MVKNAVTFSELVKSVGTVDTEMERDRTGAKIRRMGTTVG